MDEEEARPPAYSPAVHDLVRATLRSARAELLASRELVLGGREPVGIHRSRVALRRLRAALTLFREPLVGDPVLGLREDAKRLATACGPTRDIDVLLAGEFARAVTALAQLPRAPGDLAALRETALRLRRTRHQQARAALSGDAFEAFDRALGEWLDRPVSVDPTAQDMTGPLAFARERLRRRHKRIAKRLKALDELPAEARHILRLEVKKQRYAASFLAPLFDPAAARAYIGAAASLQDSLGLANDRVEAMRVVGEIAEAARPAGRLDWVAGALSGWLSAAPTVEIEDKVARAARRFARVERFWRGGQEDKEQDR
ncbi:MAG: CHAD domain-containing protein [Alphaproteobacteria bacterium]|nr:CHAD domain-containing protein [Alphaproteobacteria bacterium]MCW5742221.1 CHAD domain-containing protein [Alphaproteobacteria bacterium]